MQVLSYLCAGFSHTDITDDTDFFCRDEILLADSPDAYLTVIVCKRAPVSDRQIII